MCKGLIRRQSEKNKQDTALAHNFAKCQSIFKILSQAESAVNA